MARAKSRQDSREFSAAKVEISNLRERLETERVQSASLKEELTEARTEIERLMRGLHKLDEAVASAASENARAEKYAGELEVAKATLATLAAERTQAPKHVDADKYVAELRRLVDVGAVRGTTDGSTNRARVEALLKE